MYLRKLPWVLTRGKLIKIWHRDYKTRPKKNPALFLFLEKPQEAILLAKYK